MHTNRILTYIAIAAGALAPAACEVGAPAAEASVPMRVAPLDLPAGTVTDAPMPPSTLVTPDQTVSPHPLRSVPETYEQVAPPSSSAPPAAPTREEEAPTDGMPVLDRPTHDSMPSLSGRQSDPMPVITPPLMGPSTPMKDEPTEN
jgi:hypothetical protein